MQRLTSDDTLLLVIDVQERLLPVIHDAPQVEKSCKTLAQAAQVLALPTFLTEQYPEKLGATVPSVLSACANATSFSKKQFSSLTADVKAALDEQPFVRNIVVCGIEAHVCVLQTVLDLCATDYSVFVVRDAISSRAVQNAEIAWERMLRVGALPASVESVLFELLQTADRPEFKAVQGLIK